MASSLVQQSADIQNGETPCRLEITVYFRYQSGMIRDIVQYPQFAIALAQMPRIVVQITRKQFHLFVWIMGG